MHGSRNGRRSESVLKGGALRREPAAGAGAAPAPNDESDEPASAAASARTRDCGGGEGKRRMRASPRLRYTRLPSSPRPGGNEQEQKQEQEQERVEAEQEQEEEEGEEEERRGWVVKMGGALGLPRARFMRLRGAALASCRREDASPSWTADLRGAAVAARPHRREIVITLARYQPRTPAATAADAASVDGAAPGMPPLLRSRRGARGGARRRRRTISLLLPSTRQFKSWLFPICRAALRSPPGAAAPTASAAAMEPRLEAFYARGGVIGDGINGDVLSARDRLTGEMVAIKSLPLYSPSPPDEAAAGGRTEEKEQRKAMNAITEEEIRIACSINHPCLVRTYDVFRDAAANKVHLVMEFVPAGELRAQVDNPHGTHVSELQARHIARDLLSAVAYLHDRRIVHRDIKLENVLCLNDPINNPRGNSHRHQHQEEEKEEGELIRIKLADFGSSTFLPASSRASASARGSHLDMVLKSTVGTGYYLAPEMLRGPADGDGDKGEEGQGQGQGQGRYGSGVDIWAVGVLLYITLSRQLPFVGYEMEEYFDNVLHEPLQFPEEDWKGVSATAMQFISSLMEKEASRRSTAREAMRHAWIRGLSAASAPPADAARDGHVEDSRLHPRADSGSSRTPCSSARRREREGEREKVKEKRDAATVDIGTPVTRDDNGDDDPDDDHDDGEGGRVGGGERERRRADDNSSDDDNDSGSDSGHDARAQDAPRRFGLFGRRVTAAEILSKRHARHN